MTEDVNNEFDTIINAGFSVPERGILNTIATAYSSIYPLAKRWTYTYLPDYFFDPDTPIVERIDLIGFGIDGYFDFQFADTNLRILNLQAELTEAENES